MDEVALWNVARGQSQIQASMNSSLSGNEPGLVAYYRCDGSAGPLADSTPGGGHTATYNGSVSLIPSTAPIYCPTANPPPQLTGATQLLEGSLQFSFTGVSGGSYTVLVSTNVALPLNAWVNLGPAVETTTGSGQFRLTDPQATNSPGKFYRVRTP